MKRNAIEHLIKWKNSSTRKPLVIRGARQVGKTWLMKEFGNRYYKKIAYVNFESSQSLKQLFLKDFDIKRIITAIEIETGVTVDDTQTLIILDEIQEVERGIT
jgi:predicted AAA+ superfamily ATPase